MEDVCVGQVTDVVWRETKSGRCVGWCSVEVGPVVLRQVTFLLPVEGTPLPVARMPSMPQYLRCPFCNSWTPIEGLFCSNCRRLRGQAVRRPAYASICYPVDVELQANLLKRVCTVFRFPLAEVRTSDDRYSTRHTEGEAPVDKVIFGNRPSRVQEGLPGEVLAKCSFTLAGRLVIDRILLHRREDETLCITLPMTPLSARCSNLKCLSPCATHFRYCSRCGFELSPKQGPREWAPAVSVREGCESFGKSLEQRVIQAWQARESSSLG